MTWHGLERISPHLVVQTISSDKPVETILSVSVGWPPKDPQLRQSWNVLLDGLEKAIKSAESNVAALIPAKTNSPAEVL